MKLSSFSFAALATMGSLVSMAAADTIDFTTDITFNSENEIVDTPESLAILEDAILRASDASHDPDVWHLVSDEVHSSSHSRVHGSRRQLRPYLQYNQVATPSENYWYYNNEYLAGSTSDCNSCRRRLGERALSVVQDDAESHANWEATLCQLLAETAAFAGVSDCVITFVDPNASDVAEEKVKYYTDITFKSTAPVPDTEDLLEAFEKAMLMSADTSHDPDTWFLESTEIVSFSHSATIAADEGERKLRPWLQYRQEATPSDGYWYYNNEYLAGSTSDCNSCRRRQLSDGTAVVVKDDDESHANWEATLCQLLNEIDGIEGVTECVITFVEE